MMYRLLIFIGFVIFSWMPSTEGNTVNTLTRYTLHVKDTIFSRSFPTCNVPTSLSVPTFQRATCNVRTFKSTTTSIHGLGKSKDSHRDWKLYTALGISLASATAALLTERAANHAYDNYLTSAGPARQEHYYRRTVRYDRVSGVLWGIFEIGFIATWYRTFF